MIHGTVSRYVSSAEASSPLLLFLLPLLHPKLSEVRKMRGFDLYLSVLELFHFMRQMIV